MAKRSKKKKASPQVLASQSKPVETRQILPGRSWIVPWQPIAQALVIAAVTLWIYGPALHGDWLWDDDVDIRNNPITQSPTGLWTIWLMPGSQMDYYPIKSSVQWLQWHLWGMDTLGYHLTNVLLHILGALLVWRLLSKFGLRLAWLGGLIFAVHPVQVESVAWIAELKNTLSLPPFLLAMCAYLDYEKHGKSKDYFLALGLFLVAMLCKPTMVMFPVILLLFAWWKRLRIGWNDLKAATPFFAVSLLLGLLTVWLQSHNVTGEVNARLGGVFSRLACAGLSLSFYFSKCFLPVELMPIYPKWVVDPPTALQFLPWLVFGGAFYWLWTKRQSWSRHAFLGLGFFLFLLLPFLGLNAISYMNFTWVMDHFLYLPLIGLIGLVTAALGQIEIRLPTSFRPYSIGIIMGVLTLLAYGSHGYAKMFTKDETLWTYTLQFNMGAYPAYNNLGYDLMERGHVSDAMEQFEQALRINPGYGDAHNNLGCALLRVGRPSEAIEQFDEALEIKPDYADAHNNLGNAFQETGRLSEAIEQYEQALRIKPDYITHFSYGGALMKAGRTQEAIEQYRQALQISPDDAAMHVTVGNALQQTGQLEEAIENYEQALQINPDNIQAHNNLGIALYKSGQVLAAKEQFEEALRIKPDYASAQNNLAHLQALQKTSAATH